MPEQRWKEFENTLRKLLCVGLGKANAFCTVLQHYHQEGKCQAHLSIIMSKQTEKKEEIFLIEYSIPYSNS